ncbi:nucleoside monophosphate kinase [Candidatus Parcubacteria bacterium]|nr:nucleoside monophosphate kinase [Patescibacteria group bacterium]MCG2694156.1 nucleoside monophosphate kinase [Candidatus Parcubacteria bacterium]
MNIIFFGPQTSGKGTQTERLSEKLDIPVLRSGDILRNKKTTDDDEGREIASFIDVGKLIPDEMMNNIIKEELQKEAYKNGVIFDGYPRNLFQAKHLEEMINVDRAIFLDVPDALVLKRMAARRICSKCRAVYNLSSNPPKEEGKCNKCQGDLTQRSDDTEAAIAVRLNIYHNITEPLVNYYKEQGKLLHIDGTKSIEDVHEEILKHLTADA